MKKLFTLIVLVSVLFINLGAQSINQDILSYSQKHNLMKESHKNLILKHKMSPELKNLKAKDSKATYQRLDSMDYKLPSGAVMMKQYYNYDNSGKYLTSIEKELDIIAGQFINSYKTEITYNSSGLIETEIGMNWDENTNQWVNNYKEYYTYIAGRLSESEYSSWDDILNQWNKQGKASYTYNASNQIITELYSNWDANNSQWENSYKTENTYVSGNQTLAMSYYWDNGNSSWENSYKTESTYDVANNKILTMEYYWDSGSNLWENSWKIVYNYAAVKDLLSEISYDWDGTAWVENSKFELTYNSNYTLAELLLPDLFEGDYYMFNHMLTKYESFEWSANAWVMEMFIDLFYSPVVITTLNEISSSKISVFPNPTTDFIQVQGINENMVLEIYDISGKQILNSRITDNQIINIESLESGLYFYIIKASKNSFNGKFLKK